MWLWQEWWTAEEAVRLLIPVVEAIGSAHQAGVLHRDLKPSNIMISDNGEPFVMDFGLAKRVPVAEDSLIIEGSSDEANITQSGAILGTPSWMSPEQAAGDERVAGHELFGVGDAVGFEDDERAAGDAVGVAQRSADRVAAVVLVLGVCR